jgi:hypothetical protein
MAKFLKSMLAIAAVTAVSITCGPARASAPPYHTTVMATNCEDSASVHWENIDGALFLVIHFDGACDVQEEGGFYFPGIKGHSIQPLTFLAKLGGDGDLFWEAEDSGGTFHQGDVNTSPVPGHPGYYNCKVTLSDFDFPSNAKFQFLDVFASSHSCETGTVSATHIEVGGVLSTPNVNHVENICD